MAVASKSSRVFMQRKGLVRALGRSDTPMPLAAPDKAIFHSLPVPPKEADPLRDLTQHDFDQADHGLTTW